MSKAKVVPSLLFSALGMQPGHTYSERYLDAACRRLQRNDLQNLIKPPATKGQKHENNKKRG